ncbi:hypothetical protein [Pantoea sp. A4]|uniref:hypothetical protein n=1 Tax=Pantoea sp. A4 TaxID=1225184 RepID=UPI0003630FFF|nr:hypothetical protein [Pantoea sp. A4]
MKTLLKNWFDSLLVTHVRDDGHDAEAVLDIELLIPISQLYGFEYYPAVHRYHER